jgi:hypothetical protein
MAAVVQSVTQANGRKGGRCAEGRCVAFVGQLELLYVAGGPCMVRRTASKPRVSGSDVMQRGAYISGLDVDHKAAHIRVMRCE